MNGNENAGILTRGRQIGWLRPSKIRQVIAWPLIAVFALGSLALWQSALTNLVVVGGFAGIISWQILGFFLPVYQGRKMLFRVDERDDIGRFMAPAVMRRRLWAIITVIWVNVVANCAAIVLVLWNVVIGRLELSMWDKVAFGLAAITLIVLLIIKRQHITKSQPAMFFLVVSTRMLPQICLAFSVDLGYMPWPALLGVAAIATQRFIISTIELAEAKSQAHKSKPGLMAARWIWRADVGNLVAILIPIAAKLL